MAAIAIGFATDPGSKISTVALFLKTLRSLIPLLLEGLKVG